MTWGYNQESLRWRDRSELRLDLYRGAAVPHLLKGRRAMRTTVDGVELGFDVYGPEDSPQTLVLLHAFPLSRGQWREQATVLAGEAGIRVVTPDLPGMGESRVPGAAGDPVTVERSAQLVLAMLQSTGVADFALGGLSMGGYVALAAMRQQPQRIRR